MAQASTVISLWLMRYLKSKEAAVRAEIVVFVFAGLRMKPQR